MDLGIYYGYPECCVIAFNSGYDALYYKKLEKPYPLRGTGFVPCPSCSETKSEEQLRKEINSRRLCPKPF